MQNVFKFTTAAIGMSSSALLCSKTLCYDKAANIGEVFND